ncbi:MAG: hypothetical protein JWQ25_3260 [Daejeonella sp.]|nr:hypothetical protein [Daejeonella sp.]
MKKIFQIIIFCTAISSGIMSCKKADVVVRSPKNELGDIYATTDGLGSNRLFEPRYSTNMDTVYFDMPYFYPVNSDNAVDLKKIIIRSTVPADATVTPSLGAVMDVTQPFTLNIISGTGDKRSIVVVSKKVGDVSLIKAKIQYTADNTTQETEAIMKNNNEVLFYVLPGTNVSNATLTLEINSHSTSSIPSGSSINLSQNVPLTITGIDGSKKTYTLKATEPTTLAYGVGINRRLWTKTAADIGFNNNNESSIAISGDYLLLVTRTNPSRYRVFNRFTGAYVQDLPIPFTGLSMEIASDATGNLLGAAYAAKTTGKFLVYKWKSPTDPTPIKLIDWTNNNPTAITGDGGVGRRINIYGDLNTNAVIMAPAGQSTIIYKWTVANGLLVSNTPEVVNYKSLVGASTTFMGFNVNAQPVSAAANTNYFVNYQFEIGLVNGVTNERIIGFSNEPAVFGIFHFPMDYIEFNNAKYLGVVKFVTTFNYNRIKMGLFDVTETSKLSLASTDPRYPSFNVYNSEDFVGATINSNGTADICMTLSPDKERLQVYMLLTNGGIMAHEFTKYAP